MARQLIHTFGLKLSNPKNKKKVASSITKKSRKCLATIIFIDNKFKAKISIVKDEVTEYLVLELTPQSFNLKGKDYVFSTKLDTNGKHILVIRDKNKANLYPGLNSQYCTVREGCVISGYIIKQNDKMYFDYDEFISFSEKSPHINEVKIISNIPLFKK